MQTNRLAGIFAKLSRLDVCKPILVKLFGTSDIEP